MKLPIVKHILVFTTWGQKCPHKEPEQFTFDNFQSNHPVTAKIGEQQVMRDEITTTKQTQNCYIRKPHCYCQK